MKNFTRAAAWFGRTALLLVILVTLTVGAGIWLSIAIEPGIHTLRTVLISTVVPVMLSWIWGGLLGARICAHPQAVSTLEAVIRGGATGLLAALGMYAAFELDVTLTDYSNAVETSAARSRTLNAGVFSVVVPIAVTIGAFRGRALLSKARAG